MPPGTLKRNFFGNHPVEADHCRACLIFCRKETSQYRDRLGFFRNCNESRCDTGAIVLLAVVSKYHAVVPKFVNKFYQKMN